MKHAGIVYVLLFVLIGSFQDVYLATYFQQQDPVLTVTGTFFFGILFFSLLIIKNWGEVFRKILQEWRLFLGLNIFTAINWLGFFWALKYIEPVVASAIAFSLFPSLAALATPVLRPDKPISRLEKIAAVGMLLSILILIYGELADEGMSVGYSFDEKLLGVCLSISTSIGMVLNSFLTKRLSDKRFATNEVMAFRFYGVTIAGILVFKYVTRSSLTVDLSTVFFFAWLSVLIVIIPMSLIQKGVEKCEPITVSILVALTPAATFFFQILEGRLESKVHTAMGAFLCCFFAILGVNKSKSSTSHA